MVGVDTRDIIDIDECGLKLETSNCRFGKVVREKRCDQAGVYNAGEKLSLLLAISADEDLPFHWKETWVGEGTTLYRFYNFMERLIVDLA